MDRLTTIPLRIGDWRVDPQLGQITRGDLSERLDARQLRLLLHLANRAGETVSIEELLDSVWSGVVVTQDSVYQAITQLRRLLRDDAKDPRYIVTVPRLGYRLVAAVSPWPTDVLEPAPAPTPTADAKPALHRPIYSRRFIGASVVALVIVVLAAFALLRGDPAPPRKSVAVLPFLDLTTQEMKQEYFADGLTEALIDRLSRLPEFEVPSPTASYYYKDRSIPVAQIGRELGVRYLLDGSLRESGDTMQVSARLLRASDGFVVWSASFDSPKSAPAKAQDAIAAEVARSITGLVD